jgi:hypothetical protein
MSNLSESFLKKVVWPLIVIVLTPVITLAGSYLQSGDWLAWVKRIPIWIYPAFVGLILFWIVVEKVGQRIRRLRERNLPSLPAVITIPTFGHTVVGTITHKDVVWSIRIPAPSPWQGLRKEDVHPSQFSIGVPPHCLKCDTEIEQTETFFGRFHWSCVRCGFLRKNSISYYREAMRAEKLAKSLWNDRKL